MKTKSKSSQQGVIIPFVLIALLVLLLLVAIAFNIGWIAFNKQRAQLAVDAAALSAAAAIPHYNKGGETTQIEPLLEVFNHDPGQDSYGNYVLNKSPGITLNDVTFMHWNGTEFIPETSSGVNFAQVNAINVEKGYEVDTWFGNLLGSTFTNINVGATALLGGVSCITPDIPFTMALCSMWNDDSQGDSEDPKGPETSCGLNCCSDPLGINCDSVTEGVMVFHHNDPFFNQSASMFAASSPASQATCKGYMDPDDTSNVLTELCVGSHIWLQQGATIPCLRDFARLCADPEHDDDPDKSCSEETPFINYIPVLDCLEQFNQNHPVKGFAKIAITGAVVHMPMGEDCPGERFQPKGTGPETGCFIGGGIYCDPEQDYGEYYEQGQPQFGRICFRLLCEEHDGFGGGVSCGLNATRPILVK